MVKVTENMKAVLAVLAERENGAGFAREVLGAMKGKTFNGVNATLAAAAGKGFCTKEKAVFGEGENAKMLTRYTITAEGRAIITAEEDKEKTTERGNIKYVIWLAPDKKVNWLKDNEQYQKIEYKHEDKKKNIFIDFLLGYVDEEKTWKLWIGKIGSLSYDDDPYCDLETDKFSEAIVKSLDKTQEFIADVEEDPQNWVQYYKDI